MLRDLIDAILRLVFGHNAVDNGKDWYQSHAKAKASRAEVDNIIAASELNNKKEK
jgi:hypothetical protein